MSLRWILFADAAALYTGAAFAAPVSKGGTDCGKLLSMTIPNVTVRSAALVRPGPSWRPARPIP